MEREGLDIGISTMLNALDQARGALREIVIPTSQVFSGLSFFFLRVFVGSRISDISFLLQILVARSRKKSQFLREQKAERDRLSEEARLRANMAAQLAIVQEREAQARQDAEEAHGMSRTCRRGLSWMERRLPNSKKSETSCCRGMPRPMRRPAKS
jgi:hypothetical protein